MTFRFTCFVFIVLIFLSSCTKEEEPEMPDDKIIEVLVDVHIAEAALQGLSQKLKDSLGAVYYQQIYIIHNIKEETFLENLANIKSNPKLGEMVYEKVLEQLSKMEVEKEETEKEEMDKENLKKKKEKEDKRKKTIGKHLK